MIKSQTCLSLILICLVVVGCSKTSTFSEPGNSAGGSSQAESTSTDPVKSFEVLLSSIRSDIASPREYMEHDTGTFNADVPGIGGKPYDKYTRIRITWRVQGYDVKRTDSMVSPFEAILVLEKLKEYAYGDGQGKGNTEETRIQTAEGAMRAPFKSVGWSSREGRYSWQDGRWVTKKGYPFDPTALPYEEEPRLSSKFQRIK